MQIDPNIKARVLATLPAHSSEAGTVEDLFAYAEVVGEPSELTSHVLGELRPAQAKQNQLLCDALMLMASELGIRAEIEKTILSENALEEKLIPEGADRSIYCRLDIDQARGRNVHNINGIQAFVRGTIDFVNMRLKQGMGDVEIAREIVSIPLGSKDSPYVLRKNKPRIFNEVAEYAKFGAEAMAVLKEYEEEVAVQKPAAALNGITGADQNSSAGFLVRGSNGSSRQRWPEHLKRNGD